MGRLVDGGSDTSLCFAGSAECPDQWPELQPWNPGHDPDHYVYIGQGRALLLTSSATVYSIRISEGGKPISFPHTPHPISLVCCLRAQQIDAGGHNFRWTKKCHMLRAQVRASGCWR